MFYDFIRELHAWEMFSDLRYVLMVKNDREDKDKVEKVYEGIEKK